jgi:RNA recognition motif-containing protein
MRKKRVFFDEDGNPKPVRREPPKMFVTPGSLSSLFPLYVSNIPYRITRSNLVDLFERKGTVVRLILFMPSEKYSKAQEPSCKIAMIYYNSQKEADLARSYTDQKMFHGKRLHVVFARRGHQLPKDRTLYAFDVHPEISEEKLYDHFSKAGAVERVCRALDRDAYICFKTKEDRAKALDSSFDNKIDDKIVKGK